LVAYILKSYRNYNGRVFNDCEWTTSKNSRSRGSV